MAKGKDNAKQPDGVSEDMVARLLDQNAELMRQNAELVARLDAAGEYEIEDDEPEPNPWGEGPDPLADVDWSDPQQIDQVASETMTVTLRRGSVMYRDGKRIDGPRPRLPVTDLETAYAHKHKFQEIGEIERRARLVAQARQRISGAAEGKGQPLGYHWGPKWLAPEPIRRGAPVGPISVTG